MRIINSSFVYFCVILGLVGYALPWIVTPTAPLTLGAYDLAEWASLHPSQLTTSPALIVPLLLRVQLVIITLIIALSAQTDKLRIIAVIAIIPLSIAQLPPLEFLTIATSNINYQQQFILATISLVIGLILIKYKPTQYVPYIIVLLVGAGIISTIAGVQQAQSLYMMSLQENSLGMGVIIMCVAYLAIGLNYLQSLDIKIPANITAQPSEIKQGNQ